MVQYNEVRKKCDGRSGREKGEELPPSAGVREVGPGPVGPCAGKQPKTGWPVWVAEAPNVSRVGELPNWATQRPNFKSGRLNAREWSVRGRSAQIWEFLVTQNSGLGRPNNSFPPHSLPLLGEWEQVVRVGWGQYNVSVFYRCALVE